MSTPQKVAEGGYQSSRHYRVIGKCPKCQRPFHKKALFIRHIAKCEGGKR